MWNFSRIKHALYVFIFILGIGILAFFARPADAWENDGISPSPYFEGSDPWNSGAVDANIGITPTGDVSSDYLIEYNAEKIRQSEKRMLQAVEDAKDENW